MTVGYVKSTKLTSRILTIKGIVTQENEDLEGVSKRAQATKYKPTDICSIFTCISSRTLHVLIAFPSSFP